MMKLESNRAFSDLPEQGELGHLLLELLNNASKHQSVLSASLAFENGTIRARFLDIGEQDRAEVNVVEHFGQIGIEERLRVLGASLESAESGFSLRLGSDNG